MAGFDHMHEDHESGNVPADSKDKIEDILIKLPHDISIEFFAGKKNEQKTYTQGARDIIRFFQKISKKIKFKEYTFDHKEAKNRGIQQTPALVFNPDQYKIRWVGAPLGQESKTFLQTLIMIGSGKSGLGEQALKIIRRINAPRQIKVFVSVTCPYCPAQAVNAIRAALENPQYISVEIIDIQVDPDQARKYGAQSVPQTFTNEVLTGLGAQSEEIFAASLEKLEEQTLFIPENDAPEITTDLVIVGGGPAGLTAGIYGARSGLKTVIVEKGALGGQVVLTPMVENYPGFTQIGGKTLVDVLVNHALQYIQIFQGEEVVDAEPGDLFKITTTKRRFLAKAVLLVTGAAYRRLGAPGETRLAGRGISYCSTCDGPLFKGKKVAMIGGGDSAVTEALHLHHIGAQVTLIHRRDSLRAQQHLLKSLEQTKIPILWNTEIKEIRGREKVEELALHNTASKEDALLKVDGVFIAIGYTPVVDLAKKLGVQLTEDGYIKQDQRHRTNVPGVYSAGDVEGGYKQIVIAAGQGAGAAMTIFEDLMNPYWKKGKRHAPKNKNVHPEHLQPLQSDQALHGRTCRGL